MKIWPFNVLEKILTGQAIILSEVRSIKAQFLKLEKTMNTDLTELTAAVEETKTVGDSSVLLLNKLAEKIDSLKSDPKALAVLASSLRENAAMISAAITANTPAAE